MEGNIPVAGSSRTRMTRGQIANELKRRLDEKKRAALEKRQRMMFAPKKIIGRNDIYTSNGFGRIKIEREDGIIKQELEFLEANSSSALANLEHATEQFSGNVDPELPVLPNETVGFNENDNCAASISAEPPVLSPSESTTFNFNGVPSLPENEAPFGDITDSEQNDNCGSLGIMEEIKLEETDSGDMLVDNDNWAPTLPTEQPVFQPSESAYSNLNCVPSLPENEVPSGDTADSGQNDENSGGLENRTEIKVERTDSGSILEDSVVIMDDESDPEISSSVNVERRCKPEPPELEEISSLDTVLSAPEPDLASNDMCEESNNVEGEGEQSELKREVEELRTKLEQYKNRFGDLAAILSGETNALTVFANALPILDAHLDCQTFLALRSYCKDWQRTIDHFLETEQFQRAYLQVFEKLTHKPRKSVLLDLEKKYTFTTPENVNQFLETVDPTLENPLLGNSMVLELTAKSLGFLDQSIALTKYYEQKTNLDGVNEKLCTGLDKLCDFYWNRVELILYSFGQHLTCLTFYQYELGLTPKTLYKNLVLMLAKSRVPYLKRLIIDGRLQPIIPGTSKPEIITSVEMQRREDDLELFQTETEFPLLANLDKLEFWFDNKSTLPVLNKIFANCPLLTTIHLNGLPELSGKLLREKLIKNVVIKYLDTSSGKSSEDDSIPNRLTGLKFINTMLETLSIDSNLGRIYLAEILEICKRQPHLTVLSLRGNIQLPGNSKCRQGMQSVYIKSFSVFHTGEEGSNLFYAKLVSYFPNVQSLQITEDCKVKWNGGVNTDLNYPICNNSSSGNVYASGLWTELKQLKQVSFKGISDRYTEHTKTYKQKGFLKYLELANKFWNQFNQFRPK